MLQTIAGNWTGTKKLYFEGADGPVIESPSTLTASGAAGGFLMARYQWQYEGKPQDGLLLIGNAAPATAAWVDSFHQNKQVMFCTGGATDGGVSVTGSYEAGSGPAWGWRIELQRAGADLMLTMYNISPGGQDYLAVAAVYSADVSS